MDLGHHSESRSLTYQGLDYPQPLVANLPQEPHPPPGSDSYCLFCGHYFGASPVQNGAVYGPATCFFPIQDDHHLPLAVSAADDLAH